MMKTKYRISDKGSPSERFRSGNSIKIKFRRNENEKDSIPFGGAEKKVVQRIE
jgi:hypothetical protein